MEPLQDTLISEAIQRKGDEALKHATWLEWERTFDAIHDFVTILDPDRRVLRMNQAIADFFGIDRNAPRTAARCYELFWGKEMPCKGCPISQVLADRAMHSAEFEGRRLRRAFLVSASPIFDNAGGIVGIVHVTRDITDRKKAENALRIANEELEVRVAERTAELVESNAQLQQEIADRMHTEALLMKRTEELDTKSRTLEEANIALRVMLKAREEDRKDLEDRVISNIKELVAPYVKKLKKCRLTAEQSMLVDIIASNIDNVLSPFSHKLSSRYLSLTPREIEIANLIKSGRTTKEIAEILNTSLRTIEFHRENIRKKIGIGNRKANLRSHLLLFQ